MTDFGTEQSLNRPVFERVKKVYDTADRSKLSEEEKILLEETYNGYKNNGVLLEGKKREQYKELSQKLSGLVAAYENNLSNSAAELKSLSRQKTKTA